MIALAHAVSFTWVDHQLDGHVALVESAIEGISLRDRYGRIILTMQNQRWCSHAACEGDRRVLAIHFRMFERIYPKLQDIGIRNIRLSMLIVPVGNANG